jgi:membrane fusion protein (multidrug efflux system)
MSVRPAPAMLFLALACGLAACGKKPPPPPPPEAGFVVTRLQNVPLLTELPGRTNPFEVSDVRPQVSGVLKAQLFTEGSIVHKGQTLYQIDPSLYRAALQQAQANLQAAQATRDGAVAKANRYRPLAAIQAVAQQDYTDAEAAAKQAVASVAQNQAAVETARINLRFSEVPAPITGRIGRSLVTTGALVTAEQTNALTTIERLDPIYVDIEQSSADLLALRRAMAAGHIANHSAPVRLRLEDGSVYSLPGELKFAEVIVDPATGAVTLRAVFPNPRGLLLPGMYVRAIVTQASTSGILVPEAGVARDPQGNATALLVGPGNHAVSRNITASRTIGSFWLVTAGLRPGERVIVEGLGKIKPGQAIRPVPAGSPPRPAPATQGAAAGGNG